MRLSARIAVVVSLGWALVGPFVCTVHAQIVAPSVYTTAIQVTGEDPGTEFDDWATSGIPIALADTEDNVGAIDIHEIQIANDNNFIYVRASYYSTLSNGAYLGFDTDQDPTTGFDLFGLGILGPELEYVNDFPFEQGTGVWNTGDPLTGGPIGNGGALLFPAWDQDGMQREWAVPLDTAFTNPAAPAFTSDTFNFWVWTDSALGDVPDENTVPVTIRYTLASAPSVDGDFDNDGDYDCDDVNALVGDIAAGNNTASFDLTGDGNVNGDDLTSWLSEAGEANLGPGKAYLPGDANLSGDVDGSDFGAWNTNKFTNSAAWCLGDFNADGSVDGSDFGIWNGNKFQASDGDILVPEPASFVLILCHGAAALTVLRWRTRTGRISRSTVTSTDD